MSLPLYLHQQTREQSRASAAETLLLWPVGAIEQHGPHLAVGTDWLTVSALADAVGQQVRGQVPITIAPPLPFGSSHHHLPFGGTMSLATETYYRVLCDLVESLIGDGYRRIFLLNGHGGNQELIQLVARDLALKHPVRIAAAGYWTIAWDALVAENAHLPGRLPGHAGVFETSVMLSQHPELVQPVRPHRDNVPGTDPRAIFSRYRSEVHGSWQEIDGYTDSPDRATAESGQRWFNAIVKSVAETVIDFARQPLPASTPASITPASITPASRPPA